jgi:hypothetical protein
MDTEAIDEVSDDPLPRTLSRGMALWKVANHKVMHQIHELQAKESNFFSKFAKTIMVKSKHLRLRAEELALEAHLKAEAEKHDAEFQKQMYDEAVLAAHARNETERLRHQALKEQLEHDRLASLAAQLALLEDAKAKRLHDEQQWAEEDTADFSRTTPIDLHATNARTMPTLRPFATKPVRRKRPATELKAVHSGVMLLALSSLWTIDKEPYEMVWVQQCRNAPEDLIDMVELRRALHLSLYTKYQANPALVDRIITYAMVALDMSREAAVYDFQMFHLLGALCSRISDDVEVCDALVQTFNFVNLNVFELDVMKARHMFYLADGVKLNGYMDFDELELFCQTMQIDMLIADRMVDAIEEGGRHAMEFFDYLVYLPIFAKYQGNMHDLSTGHAGQRLAKHKPSFVGLPTQIFGAAKA